MTIICALLVLLVTMLVATITTLYGPYYIVIRLTSEAVTDWSPYV